ncbi:MAG: triose-phosphate isomerase [Dehalococcoidia bacterium]
MRVSLIAGNWKMNTTVAEARGLAQALVTSLNRVAGVEVVLCPPSISLTTVREVIRGSSLKLGAQNMHPQEKGAFTGELSHLMLRGVCDYVLLGHSERRHIFGEEDDFINKKVHAALAAGLRPILCVGETLEERESGATRDVLVRQVTRGLEGITEPGLLVIAYEPVWAIGTGRAATAKDANEATSLVRGTLSELLGPDPAQDIRILYGGSVTPKNIREFMAQPHIDGALVGGASLKAADFTSIVRCAAGPGES